MSKEKVVLIFFYIYNNFKKNLRQSRKKFSCEKFHFFSPMKF